MGRSTDVPDQSSTVSTVLTAQDLAHILAEIPGDVLLRCTEGAEGVEAIEGAEGVELTVHGDILKLASPVFRDALNQEMLITGKMPTLQVLLHTNCTTVLPLGPSLAPGINTALDHRHYFCSYWFLTGLMTALPASNWKL